MAAAAAAAMKTVSRLNKNVTHLLGETSEVRGDDQRLQKSLAHFIKELRTYFSLEQVDWKLPQSFY